MGSPRSVIEPLYDFCVAAPREQEPTEGVIYVNWARAMMTPYDLILDLGFRTEDGPPAKFPIRTVMSWEQAKDLLQLLTSAVEEYESEVGGIRELGTEVLESRDTEGEDDDGARS